jgi:hypothetical protein
MCRPTLRILAYLTLAVAFIGSDAHAGVGDMSGGASFGRLSPVQTVQYGGDCWYDDGWNGPGYYPCGNEWNSGFGGAGPVAPIIVPAIRRHHRHSVIVTHPGAANHVYPGAQSPRPRAIGASGANPGLRRFGAVRAHTPNFHTGAATVTPGFTGGGFHGSLSGGNFHQFHSAGLPHISAPVSPGFTGVGGFHSGGAIGTPHIGAPATPGLAGVGTFHPSSGVGAPHIGAPASPGLAGGGFHGVGGAGIFQGGAASFGQGGIGHR